MIEPVYQSERVTVYHGDCLEVIPHLEPMDLTITDPPYDEKTHAGADKKYSDIKFAPLACGARLTEELLLLSRRWCICFCAVEMIGAYAAWAGEAWIRAGVWDKITPMPQMTGDRPAQAVEGVAIMHRKGRKKWNGGGKAAIWRHRVEHGNKSHPTQKPVNLFSELVKQFAMPGETIFDPFAGSGTTGVAALRQGCQAILIEKDEQYIQIIIRRIEAEEQVGRLF